MHFKRGLHPADPARKLVRVSAENHPAVAAALKTLRGSADLEPAAPMVLNQGNSETCWAHSAVTLLFTRRKLLGGSPALQSPLFFAQCMYAAYRAAATPAGQDFATGLVDQGAQLDDAAKCFGQWGTQPFGKEEQLPAGGTDVPATSDADGHPIDLPELTAGALMAGMNAVFGGEYDIQPSASNALDLCAAALEAGIPIWTGNLVGQAYQALLAGQVAGPCPTSDPTAGGHAQAVIGYETVSGKRRWKVRNSWGDGWCSGGDALVDDDFMAAAWSLLPFEVTP
jgi:hypothetical protein